MKAIKVSNTIFGERPNANLLMKNLTDCSTMLLIFVFFFFVSFVGREFVRQKREEKNEHKKGSELFLFCLLSRHIFRENLVSIFGHRLLRVLPNISNNE